MSPFFNRNQEGICIARAQIVTAQVEEEKASKNTITNISQTWQKYHLQAIKWNQYTKALTELAQKNEISSSIFFKEGQIQYADYLIAQRNSKQAQLDSLGVWQETSSAAWTLSCLLVQHDQLVDVIQHRIP